MRTQRSIVQPGKRGLAVCNTTDGPRGIMLSEISQPKKDMRSHSYGESKSKNNSNRNTNSQTLREGWWLLRRGAGAGKTGEGGRKAQTPSYK